MTAPENISEQPHFKTILTDIFQEKFYSSLLQGSMMAILQELMGFVHKAADGLEREGKSPEIVCQDGCSYCCYSNLRIIPAEALFIISFIETHFDAEKLSGLKKKIALDIQPTDDEIDEEKNPCLFLDKNSCSIYPVRPFICRALNSVDRTACESAFSADTYPAGAESASVIDTVFLLARALVIDLSCQVNLQYNKLEMSQALFNCMNIHNPEALWMAGYHIFNSELDFRRVDPSLTEFRPKAGQADAGKEFEYVDYFYGKYQGRVALGVGYDQNFSEIYPFIFQNAYGHPIGIVAMGIVDTGEKLNVHIHHIGAFITQKGAGSLILNELCRKADCFNIRLGVSPVYMPNGTDPQMDFDRLSEWYNRFNFKGESYLMRTPREKTAGPSI